MSERLSLKNRSPLRPLSRNRRHPSRPAPREIPRRDGRPERPFSTRLPRFSPRPGGRGLWLAADSVHPRACGEQNDAWALARLSAGSSPRLRGTDARVRRRRGGARFIPAPAGNSQLDVTDRTDGPVHPRACGEQMPPWLVLLASVGSSPRLRGTGIVWRTVSSSSRFIPAPAGNRRVNNGRLKSSPVHPRACGEQPGGDTRLMTAPGSSPRLRGTAFAHLGVGLDPRFIPAPAGNSATTNTRRAVRSVHPRACGEQLTPSTTSSRYVGSSPRLRGTEGLGRGGRRPRRFIPAPAGNRSTRSCSTFSISVHPRACGEQVRPRRRSRRQSGSSPRLRGTGRERVLDAQPHRFIPAPAGNSPPAAAHPRPRPVHPRACGEQSQPRSAKNPPGGSSPRLRGTVSAGRIA